MKINRTITFFLVSLLPTLTYAGILDNMSGNMTKVGEEAYEQVVKTATENNEWTKLVNASSADSINSQAIKNTQPVSNTSKFPANQTSPRAISTFEVDGLSLDIPYREIHDALLARGYMYTGRAQNPVEEMENAPKGHARFNKLTGESRDVNIGTKDGQIKMIRYEFDSPSFDPSSAIKNAQRHLGNPLKPCSQDVVEYQVCVWEDAPGNKHTGRVRLEIRKTSGRTPSFKVKYRMDRSLVHTAYSGQ